VYSVISAKYIYNKMPKKEAFGQRLEDEEYE